MTEQSSSPSKPTAAFVGASWAVLFIGVIAFAIGLWNAKMALSEKGFYAAVMVLGLFAAISLQKSVRDRTDGLPVSGLYLGLSWSVLGLSLLMLTIGLWNATMALSEKGFYAMAFTLSLFASVAVQKNVRDALQFRGTSHAASSPNYLDRLTGIVR